MESAGNYNPVLEALHRMHKQFALLHEQVEGDQKRVRGTEARIAGLKAKQEEAIKNVLSQRIAIDTKQAQLDENEKEVGRKKKLQDEAKNEREFNNLRDLIAAAEAANAVLSDEILEGLDYLDQLKEKAEEAKKNLQEVLDLLEDLKARAEERGKEAMEKFSGMQGIFQETSEQLDGEHRMVYQRLYSQKKFESLAAVVGQCCTGCHTKIPFDLITKIVSCEKAVVCPICGRMLYAPENHHV